MHTFICSQEWKTGKINPLQTSFRLFHALLQLLLLMSHSKQSCEAEIMLIVLHYSAQTALIDLKIPVGLQRAVSTCWKHLLP